MTACAQNEDGVPASDDLFFFRPDTPERQVRGALLAERLDRPGLALGYLTDLIDSNPTADQLRELREKFGIGVFLKLAAAPALQPTSGELLKLVNEATRQPPPSADTVEVLIRQLGRSQQQTTEAALKILAAEDAAVVPLLSADIKTRQGELAAGILQKYARRLRRGLVAALPDADDAGKVRILQLLGETAAPELSLDLLPHRFSKSAEVAAAANKTFEKLRSKASDVRSNSDAAGMLLDEVQRLLTLSGKTFPTEADVLAEQNLARQIETVHDTSADSKSLAETQYGGVLVKRATDLADKAAEIAPESDAVTAAQLVTQAAEQAWPIRWPESMSGLAEGESSSTETFVEALRLAVDSENAAATIPLLLRQDSAVVAVQRHPEILRKLMLANDVRVRLMAASVAKAADVSNSMSRQTVAAVVTGSPLPEAVVIDSRTGEGSSVAAVLSDMNYSVKATSTGRSGFDAATSQLHCEVVLVHSNCLRWSLSDTVTNLRTDYRTKDTPIIIYGPVDDELATDTIRTRFGGVWFIAEPISDITFSDTLKLLNFPPPSLTEGERKAMIRFARSLR